MAYFFNNKLLGICAGFFIICLASSCENSEKDINTWTKNKVMREEAVTIESYLSQEGKMKAKLTAPLMYRVLSDSQYVEFPKSLHVDFYNDLGQIETRLDSKYGKYYENQNQVYLRDSVKVITTKGDTLLAPDLWWDQNKGLFYTDKYVTYHSTNQELYGGKGLEATQDLKSVTFKSPTGNLKVEGTGL